MGGGISVPAPPPNWQKDPTLNFTNAAPLPRGAGRECFIAPSLPLGTPLDPDRILTCDPGFFCPFLNQSDSRTLPVVCPANVGCASYRLTGLPCSAQGLYEPIICKPGFFCPDFKTMLRCPKGYYCPTGTVKPHRCTIMTSCPKGSVYQLVYSFLVIIAVIDGILLIVWLAFRIKTYRKHRILYNTPNLSDILKIRCRVFLARFLEIFTKKKADPTVQDTTNPPTRTENLNSHTIDSIPVEELSLDKLRHDLTTLRGAFKDAFPLHGQVRMNFTFEGLELALKDGRKILSGVTGKIREGRMTAIIGPSGAGKTTFMHTLMGKVSKTGGKIMINGRESEVHAFRKIIGYVPQEDIMLQELTVKENVLHSARVRLPRSWTAKQVNHHVDNVLKALKLSQLADSIIGDEAIRGISGGQRKRVNIGMELAAAPLAIFLDEPTSGLDATSALEVTDILSSMAFLGITIVAVVHQPRIEIFRKFDDVIMVAPGGRIAFMGPVTLVQSYFTSLGFEFEESANVSDVAMDILAGKGRNPIAGALTAPQVVELWENNDLRMDFIQRVAVEKAKPVNEMGRSNGSLPADEFLSCYETLNSRASSQSVSAPKLAATRESTTGTRQDIFSLSRMYSKLKPSQLSLSSGENASSRASLWGSSASLAESDELRLLGKTSISRSTVKTIRRLDTENSYNESLGRYQKYVSPFNLSPLRRLHPKKRVHENEDSDNQPVEMHILDQDVPPLIQKFSHDVNHAATTPSHKLLESSRKLQSEYSCDITKQPRDTHSDSEIIINQSEVSFTKSYSAEKMRTDNQKFHALIPSVIEQRGASFFWQLVHCHNRSIIQQSRRINAFIMEITVAVFAGVLMGISTQGKVKELYAGIYIGAYKAVSPRPVDVISLYCFLVGLAVALASAPSAVKVFGEEKHVYWREAASGHSRLAYFLGKTLATICRIIIMSLHFTAFYMILAKPIIAPHLQYIIIALEYWGVYGLSCIISMVVRRENASLLAVVMCLFASVFCGYGPSITQAKNWKLNWLMDMSFNKWAAEAMYAASVNIYKNQYDVDLVAAQFGWSLNQIDKDLVVCFFIGLIARVLGFVLLVVLHRDKQR
ncbi:hypothetical protein HDU77_003139 [Chytriomyces hyalinus]|nr:hypothetical protein HDU77_003139 [Chytriomyces hyalinus]